MNMTNFSENFKAILKEKNIKASALAIATDCSEGCISFLKHGRNMPSYQVFIRLCVALDVEPHELIGDPKTELNRLESTNDGHYRNTEGIPS